MFGYITLLLVIFLCDCLVMSTDFDSDSFWYLFETEVNRRIRKEPVVIEKEFFEPLVVNTKEGEDEQEEGVHHASTDVVNDIWVFS